MAVISRNKKIDTYLKAKPDWSREILQHLRELMHEADPETEEVIKWGVPFFAHGGVLIAGMSSYQKHVRFCFWKGVELKGLLKHFRVVGASGMSASHWESLQDLPSDRQLLTMMRQAVRKAAAQKTVGKKAAEAVGAAGGKRLDPRRPHPVPADLAAALRKDAKARKVFEAFAWSDRRDYVEWLEEAKREATRDKRLAATLELLREGKTRHWKYKR